MKELTSIQKSAIKGMKRSIESLEKKKNKLQSKVAELLIETEEIDSEMHRAKNSIESYTECAYEDLFPEEISVVPVMENIDIPASSLDEAAVIY